MRAVTKGSSTCERCKGTAIDPERFGTETYGDGTVRPVPEPCIACQYPEVPMRPFTADEIDALPVLDLDDLFRRLGPPSPTKEQQ